MTKRPFEKPVYYIYGPESCLLDDFLDRLKDAVLTPGFESMNYHVYYAESLDITEALTEAKTMPAFSDRRLIVIKKASSLRAAAKEALLGYLSDPSPWSVLVFVANKAKPGLQGKFLAALKAKGEVKALRPPYEEKIGEWLTKEARSYGKTISREACENLIGLTGGSLTALKSEFTKIILFTGDKKRIDADDVAEAGLDVKADTIFNLSDAIGNRDLKKAFSLYARLSTEPSLLIIGAIARHMRVLIKLKTAMQEGLPAKSLASVAGVPPFTLKKYRESCRLFTMEELKRAIRYLFEMDKGLKTSALPEEVAMTNLIIRLCQ